MLFIVCDYLSAKGSPMNITVEQIAEEALALPSEARALLADRLVESLDPLEDGYFRQVWTEEARQRLDDVRTGKVTTIPGEAALAQVRQSVSR
jgi:Putative addiction module component